MITFTSGLEQELKVEFLDHFKSYITKYLQFVSFMSYCWFYSNKESGLANEIFFPDFVYQRFSPR